jgi:hypothetical protein
MESMGEYRNRPISLGLNGSLFTDADYFGKLQITIVVKDDGQNVCKIRHTELKDWTNKSGSQPGS